MGDPNSEAHNTRFRLQTSRTHSKKFTMDAVRKKMKSLKDETDQLYAVINKFEEATKESNRVADQADCDIRDYGKKVHGFEIEFDETTDKLNKALAAYEELDKNLRQTIKMASDNEQKLDELNRKLGVQEEELKRAIDRAELAEKKLKEIEEELQMVGEN